MINSKDFLLSRTRTSKMYLLNCRIAQEILEYIFNSVEFDSTELDIVEVSHTAVRTHAHTVLNMYPIDHYQFTAEICSNYLQIFLETLATTVKDREILMIKIIGERPARLFLVI